MSTRKRSRSGSAAASAEDPARKIWRLPNSQETRKVKVGVVQEKWTSDAEAHKKNLTAGVKKAVDQGAQVVLLQELTLSHYWGSEKDKKWFDSAEDIATGPSAQFFSALAKEHAVHIVGSLFERATDNNNNNNNNSTDKSTSEKFYNTAAVWSPAGERVGTTRKQHIPRGDGYDEDFYFAPGDSDYPVHDLGFVRLAIPTCYDQWFPELARIYALKGAELILYPTAIGSEPNFAGLDTQPQWQLIMQSHAIANGVFVGAANRTGKEDVTFYGSSFLCDPLGRIVAKCDRDKPGVIVEELDMALLEFWQTLFPLKTQRQPTTYGRLLQN